MLETHSMFIVEEGAEYIRGLEMPCKTGIERSSMSSSNIGVAASRTIRNSTGCLHLQEKDRMLRLLRDEDW